MKANNRKTKTPQQLIASFFAPAGQAKKPFASSIKPQSASTPPRHPLPSRAAAPSSRSTSTTRGAFDDIASSDTSFGSPEIHNFRNPSLDKAFSNEKSGLPERKKLRPQPHTILVESDTDKENHTPQIPSSPIKKPTLERSASSNVFDLMSAKPKKVAKKTPSFAAPLTPTLVDGGPVVLSEEQMAIVNYVVNKGESVFFTGSAGTGKSVVLRQLVVALKRKHGEHNVGITASTGLAACNIEGQTVHKYLGIGIGTGTPQDLANKIKRIGTLKKRWKSLAVLIIDEISMIDGTLFTKLDHLGRILRNNPAPFGGIQLVCTGDFFQLPPVSRDQRSQYCFQSDSWPKAITHTITLTQVFRQKGDSELIDMLNALRKGVMDPPMAARFHKLLRKVHYDDGIEPTELFPTRQEVKKANDFRLQQLPGRLFTYVAKDNTTDPFAKKLYDNLMCEGLLALKEGAQVMYLKNHPDNVVVNGSIGTVIGFISEGLWGLVCSVFGVRELVNPSFEFLLMLRLVCGLVGRAEYTDGQREMFAKLPAEWKSKVEKLRPEATKIDPSSELLPIVNFKTGHNVFCIIMVRREEFAADAGKVQNKDGQFEKNVTREQLPLLLAWAMSIHKAQGQSIDRLRVDLRKIFEKGQVYVALSRATNKDQLEVLNFDPKHIAVSEEVRQFYDSLARDGGGEKKTVTK